MPTPAAVLEAQGAMRTLAETQKGPRLATSSSPAVPSPELQTTETSSGAHQTTHSASPAAPLSESPKKRFQGTLLGVAQPGIAPIHNSAPSPPAPISGPGAVPSSQSWSPPSSGSPSSFPQDVTLPRSGRPLWQTAILVGLGIAGAAGIGATIAAVKRPDLSIEVTRFSVDEEGRDHLELSCEQCTDGTSLTVSGATTKFQNHRGTLIMSSPLSLGENTFQPQLKNAEGQELSGSPLIVPVAFRMSSNWKGRHESPPSGQVLLEAPKGSIVKMGDKTVEAPFGKATYVVEFAKETAGESSEVEKVALDVPIEVTTKDKKRSTRASLRGAVTPLTLLSMGPMHQITKAPITLTGITAPSATVRWGSQSTTADAEGAFRLVLSSPEESNNPVEAETDELLTRRVEVQLKKSLDLSSNTLIKEYSKVSEPGMVQLRATVVESRITEGVTRSVLETRDGCSSPPCLISAVYPSPKSLRPNRTVTVTGWAEPGDPLQLRVSRF